MKLNKLVTTALLFVSEIFGFCMLERNIARRQSLLMHIYYLTSGNRRGEGEIVPYQKDIIYSVNSRPVTEC